jgi:hypothetical protein
MTCGLVRPGGVLSMQGPMSGLITEEESMKLISTFELQKRSDLELSAMFCQVSKGLVRTKRHSPERRNALASLENISRARAQRMVMRPAL